MPIKMPIESPAPTTSKSSLLGDMAKHKITREKSVSGYTNEHKRIMLKLFHFNSPYC